MNNEYCKIPAFIVRNQYLSSNAKLLYGDLLLLSHKDGYCYATNKFLGNNLNLTERTITRLIKELKELNFITISYSKDNTRQIYLIDKSIYQSG